MICSACRCASVSHIQTGPVRQTQETREVGQRIPNCFAFRFMVEIEIPSAFADR